MRYLPFLFLILTSVAFAADDASDKQSTQYSQERQFNVAQKTQIDGLYDNALKLWNEFLEKYPKSNLALEAKYNRGLCSYELQKYEDAKRDLDEVLNSGNKNIKKAEALLFSGLSAQRLSEKNPAMVQEAKNRLEALLKEFPNSEYNLFAKFNLAKTYELLKKPADAQKLYVEIWQKSPKSEYAPDAYLQTGYILLNQKSYSQCARLAMEFSKRWNIQPEIYTAAVLAGDALYSSGDFEQAEKQYAFASDPTAKGIDKFDQADYALYNRGACLLQLRNYEKAAQMFSDVITRFPKSKYIPAATLACGDANWKSQNVQKAKDYLLKAAKFEEYSPKANLILAEVYFKENDINNALKRIDMTPESQFKCLPTEPEAQQTAVRQACVLRVNILSRSDDPKRLQTCVKLCDRIALQWSDSPSAPWATLLAAQIEFLLHNYDNAISLCHKIQTQWKDSLQKLESQILEACCLVQNQKYKEAGNLYYSLYKNNPNDDRRFEWLILTCKMLEMFQQYDVIYKILPKEIPNIQSNDLRPEALYLSGKAACELNKLDYALKVVQFCQDKHPDYPDMDKVLFTKGVIYEKQGNNGKALETFQKILDDYPDSPVKQGAVSYMTQLYRVLGNFKAALEQADTIIAQDKESQYRPAAVIDSMYILVQNSMWEQALKRGDLFIEDYPQHDSVVEAYRLRALCKYNLNKFADASADCRKGLEIAKQMDQMDKWELSLRQLEVSSLSQQDNKIDETQKAFAAFMDAKKRLDKTIANEDSVIFLYANALFKADKKEEAYQQYKYIFDNYKASPYRFESAFSLGQAEANAKSYVKAKEFLTFAVNGSDSSAAIKSAHKLGWISYNQESYEDALKWFNRAVEINDASKGSQLPAIADIVLDSRLMAADCLYWQKKFAEALTQYKSLPELPVQRQAMATIRAAQCAIETGDFNLAAKLIDKVLDANNVIVPELAPTSKKWEPAMQHLRAKIWFKTDKQEQSEKLFEQIVKENADVNPASVPAATAMAIAESWFYLGELAFQKEKYRDAITQYYNVIYGYKFPELQGDACYEAARCFEALKQVTQARKMYQKILDDYPGCSKAQTAKTKLQHLK